MERRPLRRHLLQRSLVLGIEAGLTFAVADWAASGLARLPAAMILLSLSCGVVAGGLAGSLAAVCARPGLASALVLAGCTALEGLSVASKEIPTEHRPLAAGLALCAALLGGWAALRSWPEKRLAVLGAILSLVAASALAGRCAPPWVRLLAVATPLLFSGLWALGLGTRAARPALPVLFATPLAVLVWLQPRSDGVWRDPAPASRTPAPSGPSLVLVVIDTLRADAIRPEGALAGFAREGVEFRQCVSAAPWTLPSVGSLLTGVYPSQHGAFSSRRPLAASVTTLAERLRERGYATGAFTGGAFVGLAHGFQRGFERFDPTCERRFSVYGGHIPLLWRAARNRYWPQRWVLDLVDAYQGLAGGLEAACAWAREERARPKFLLLHTYQVHDYFLYEPDFDDEVLARLAPPSARFAGRLWVDPEELPLASASDIAHFRALYTGRVAALERLFPRLVSELTPLVGEDAVWIVTADHGEGFDAERHRVHHGGRLHDDLLRVPLFVRAQGRLAPGQVVSEQVRTVDVLPTALELLGLPVPEELAGESLLPALRGERPFPSEAFAEERKDAADLVALRRGGWKLIQGPGHAELYDLTADPAERQRVEAVPAGLQEELQDFRRRFPPAEAASIELDPATQQQLEDLGY